MALKLPAAMPKNLHPLAWVILAAEKEGETEGVKVEADTAHVRLAVATDRHRLHVATVPHLAVGPGCYDPPGWADPDWHEIEDWSVDWHKIEDRFEEADVLGRGHVVRVDMLYGYCRSSIAYGQSVGASVAAVTLKGQAISARLLADALVGGWGDIMGAEVELRLDASTPMLAVRHATGRALMAGVRPGDPLRADLADPVFDATEFVRWEG